MSIPVILHLVDPQTLHFNVNLLLAYSRTNHAEDRHLSIYQCDTPSLSVARPVFARRREPPVISTVFSVVRTLLFPFLFLLASLSAAESVASHPPLSAQDIMQRVIAHQTEALEARRQWVYTQEVFVRSQQRNKTVMREETRLYRIIPDPQSQKRELISVKGRYRLKRQLIDYDKPTENGSIDDVVSHWADQMTDPKQHKSRDGVDTDLFPLAHKHLDRYTFTLKGSSEYRGHQVYEIEYRPAKKPQLSDDNDEIWAGTVLVDQTAFQPVFINSFLAVQIPMAVKILLGTNVRDLGFKVEYEKFDGDVWFPVRGGGEFRLDAVFFWKRNFSYSWNCRDFQKTTTATSITFEEPK